MGKEWTEIQDRPLIEQFRKVFLKKHAVCVIYLKTWLKKWESLDETQFTELIDICVKMYPCIIKIACKPFVLSALKYEDIEIKSLSIITDSSAFIQALQKEQDFAFETTRIKRDNIIHQFRVFLLGYYLLSKYDKLVNWLWEGLLGLFGGMLKEQLKEQLLEKDKKREIVLGLWALTALFHDCGRGIQTFYQSLRNLKASFAEIFTTFKLDMPVKNTDVQLNDLWQEKKRAFFYLLEYFINRGGNEEYYEEIKRELEEAMEEPRHGIISAILITYPEAKKLLSRWKERSYAVSDFSVDEGSFSAEGEEFEAFNQTKKNVTISEETIRKVILPFYAALAVAFHDIEEYWFLTPLTEFLILCDNLQEWGRLTKIGDQVDKIFPCEEIKLKVMDEDIVEVNVEIPYKSPPDSSAQRIFERWQPEKKWQYFKNKIKAKQKDKIFTHFHTTKIRVKISFFKEKTKGKTIKIP